VFPKNPLVPIDGKVLIPKRGQAMDCPASSTKSPPDMNLPMNVPAEKLLELLKTSNEMKENIFLNDHRAMLRTVVRHISSLLEVESCAIFLVPEDHRLYNLKFRVFQKEDLLGILPPKEKWKDSMVRRC
jgi:hypothetical protein